MGKIDELGRAVRIEQIPVTIGSLSAPIGPCVEVPELDAEHRGLERVEPRVEADLVVMVLGLHAVNPQPASDRPSTGSLVVIMPPSPKPPRFFDG